MASARPVPGFQELGEARRPSGRFAGVHTGPIERKRLKAIVASR